MLYFPVLNGLHNTTINLDVKTWFKQEFKRKCCKDHNPDDKEHQ